MLITYFHSDGTTSGITVNSVTVFPNTVSDYGVYVFTFTLTSNFTPASWIRLVFPSDFKFASENNAYCTINSARVACDILFKGLLLVTGTPNNITAGTPIVLSISNFRNPTSTSGSFNLDVIYNTYASQACYSRNITAPSIVAALYVPVVISGIYPTSNYTYTSHYITFQLTVSQTTATNDIIMIYLQTLSLINNALTSCYIYDGTTNTTLTCGTQGYYITVNLGTLTLTTTSTYNLTVGPIKSQLNVGDMGDPIFLIVNSGMTTVKQKSYRTLNSYNMPFYIPSLSYLRVWYQGSEATALSVTAGTISDPFYFNTSRGLGYPEQFQITIQSAGLSSSGFTILPSTISVVFGQQIQSFAIEAGDTAGIMTLSFLKTVTAGNTILQTPPDIYVLISAAPIIIAISPFLIIGVNELSTVQNIVLSNGPTSDITISLTMSSPNLTVASPSTGVLNFGKGATTAAFILQTTSAASDGDFYTVSLSISGTNSYAYILTTSTIIISVTSPTSLPLQTSFNVSLVKSTSIDVNITNNVQCYIVYQIGFPSSPILSMSNIISNVAKNGIQYTDSATGISYGMQSIPQSTTPTKYTFSSLHSSTDYVFVIYPMEINGTGQAMVTIPFKTAGNLIRVLDFLLIKF